MSATMTVLARRCAGCAEQVPVSDLDQHRCPPPSTVVVRLIRLERRRAA